MSRFDLAGTRRGGRRRFKTQAIAASAMVLFSLCHFNVGRADEGSSNGLNKEQYANSEMVCNAPEHWVVVDRNEGKWRYRAWNKPGAPPAAPNMQIDSGSDSQEGSGPCRYTTWTFSKDDVTFEVGGLGCTDGSEPRNATGQLRVKKKNKIIAEWYCTRGAPSEATSLESLSERADARSTGFSSATETFRAVHLEWEGQAAPKRMSWRDSQAYCATLHLRGSGWRLPTQDELSALFTARGALPSLVNDSRMYWSSTGSGDEGMLVDYANDGNRQPAGSNERLSARCVRGAFAPETFRAVGLEWQGNASRTQLTWEAAKSYCSGLRLGGAGWRLPAVEELQRLYGAKAATPALAIDNGSYWSSTAGKESFEEPGNLKTAMIVMFENGYVLQNNSDTGAMYVRCVRGGTASGASSASPRAVIAPSSPQPAPRPPQSSPAE